jgi:hypothetical protein
MGRTAKVWVRLNDEIDALHEQKHGSSKIARILIEKHGLGEDNLNALRLYVSRRYAPKGHEALSEECESLGIPVEDVNHYWHKGKHFSIHAKNNQKGYFEIKDEIIGEMQEYAPTYPNLYYPEVKDGHLLVIDPADIHIGKLCSAFETGEEYNSQIAVRRVKDGIHGILSKVHGFNIDKILLIIGNDCLHVDTPKSTTTSGTFQDSHLMWYDAFRIAMELYKDAMEILVQIAPVHVQYDPSNHDYTHGFFLAHALEAWFSKSKNITFDVSIAHRKYFQYHGNLIGTSHGDGAKTQDLPLLMAQEAAKPWAECKHRYFYIHHIHHKMSKDHGSVCVESLRSPSGTDGWHHRNGYQHAPKAVEGFIHHKIHGQIARITHIF